MGWLIYRIAATALAALAGGLVGSTVGGSASATLLGAVTGVALASAALLAIDGLRGHAFLQWLRGSRDGGGAAQWRVVGRDRLSRRALDRPARTCRRAGADSAVAVPVGDRGLAQWRAVARRDGPDRVVQQRRRRPLRAGPSARPSSARDQPGARTCVRELPARRALGQCRELARPARQAHVVGPDSRLRRSAQAGAVAGHHRARAGRHDAARLRSQRLARDSHATDRALRIHRDDGRPAADRQRAAPHAGLDGAAGRRGCKRWSATC